MSDTKEFAVVSTYVQMRDGVRLALDIYMADPSATPSPLPVIWTMDRYRRRQVVDGRPVTNLDRHPWVTRMVHYGYAVAVADIRGGGASYGRRAGSFTEEEARDAYDVTEWLATQPWSNGRVGMFGRSYLGIVQYLAAATRPPHLVTIVPEKAMFDLYDFICPGGSFRADYKNWVDQVRARDLNVDKSTIGVVQERSELAAVADHHQNRYDDEIFGGTRFRDSADPETGLAVYQRRSPARALAGINASDVSVLHIGGWMDMWPRDTILWYLNTRRPQRMVIGPWAHKEDDDALLFEIHRRWYDHWLKGEENGIKNEPSIRYYVMDAPDGAAWRASDCWPPEGIEYRRYFLSDREDREGTSRSVNDGSLTSEPSCSAREVWLDVDFTTTTGTGSRWSNGYRDGFGYPDLAPNDAKGLTYTSAVLEHDVEVIGHPIATLSIETNVDDLDLFVYFEEVDQTGRSAYVTEGVLRLSHRRTAPNPHNTHGLPWHSSERQDVTAVPKNEPVHLQFDLHPTAKRFTTGRRMRISIACADIDNNESPTPASTRLRILSTAEHASNIILPIRTISSS